MSDPTATIRVLLVDDEQVIRDTLSLFLTHWADTEVVGVVNDGRAGVEAANLFQPDVVLMDMRMPRLDGIAATREILAAHPRTRVIMLSAYSDDTIVEEALAAGACRFLLKGAPPRELREVLLEAVGAIG